VADWSGGMYAIRTAAPIVYAGAQTGKQLNYTALPNKSYYSHDASLVIWDHTVLPATRHK